MWTFFIHPHFPQCQRKWTEAIESPYFYSFLSLCTFFHPHMFHFHPHFHPILFLRSFVDLFVVVAAIALRSRCAALLRRVRFSVFAVLLCCVRTVAVGSDTFLAVADIFAYLTLLVETWEGSSSSSWVCLRSRNWRRLGIHLCALLTHVRVIMSCVWWGTVCCEVRGLEHWLLLCCGASVKVWKSLLNVLRSFGSVRYGMVCGACLGIYM